MNITELAMNVETADEFLDHFQQAATATSLRLTPGVLAIIRALKENPDLGPRWIKGVDAIDIAGRWLQRYWAGFDGRASRRVSRTIATIPDPAVDRLIATRLKHLHPHQHREILHAHRLSMQAENVLGLLLEEYVAVSLEPFGWHCAWGEVLRSVDFVHDSGALLQVKNRSNSENSSSARVRLGTPIEKWHRINAHTGATYWDQLNQLVNAQAVSESGFLAFAEATIESNPSLIALESDNVWQSNVKTSSAGEVRAGLFEGTPASM